MIYDALIAPTESSTTLLEVKRALLTYNKVLLLSPDDRDMFPPQAWLQSLVPFFPLPLNAGPVRPLGKRPGYDDDFAQMLGELADARREGLIDIISIVTSEPEGQISSIGYVEMHGYPLRPDVVNNIYRSSVNDPQFLRLAVQNDAAALTKTPDILQSLALPGRADASWNDSPPLPLLDGELQKEEFREALTPIARARIGTVIKTAGYCEAKNLIPIFTSRPYASILSRYSENANRVLDFEDQDQQWVRRNQLLNLCHREFLGDEVIAAMPLKEILKFRTRAWGRQAEARERLFDTVYGITLEHGDGPNFEGRMEQLISDYRSESAELEAERKGLGFKIFCDLGAAAIITEEQIFSLLQTQSWWGSAASLLLFGAIPWTLTLLGQHRAELEQYRAKRRELQRGLGFAVSSFYPY